MLKYFNKTSIGYSHIKSAKPCQDYSASYNDIERTIVTACDGHGGKVYVRSNLGSKFASQAIVDVFRKVERSWFYKYTKEEIADKLKLEILCRWNELVEQSYSRKSISKREIENLSEDDLFKLKTTPAKAYGTTLNGAMVFGNKLICVNLGDGGVFVMRSGEITSVFAEDEDNVANITYSMCADDAFNHINIAILDFNTIDGVLVFTDGLINPYQNMVNFQQSFVKPITLKVLENKYDVIDAFIERLGCEIGIGDDVSFSCIVKSCISTRHYKR